MDRPKENMQGFCPSTIGLEKLLSLWNLKSIYLRAQNGRMLPCAPTSADRLEMAGMIAILSSFRKKGIVRLNSLVGLLPP